LIGGVRRVQASQRRQGWAYVEKGRDRCSAPFARPSSADGAPDRSLGVVNHLILSHRNALIFQRNFFLPTVKARLAIRQNFSLLISKEKSGDLSSTRFRPLSPTICRFF
jgi:hypothetical protein